MAETILRINQVKKITGLARSSIYFLISEGTFPKQVHLGERSVGWVESDVANWIQSKIDDSRSGK